jgi:2-(1,2-epoxy-1,2-dihydrophenyl)acetyl-CoA isomerase
MTDEPRYASVEGLSVDVADTVLRIVIDRPGHHNSLTDTSVVGLIRVLEAAATDDAVRAVLLSGAGEDFCSGFDIVARNAGTDTKPRTGSIQRRMPTQANRLIPLLLDLQLPVVCAVQGWAVGLGAQIALVADFTITATDARFWYPFLERGFTPDAASSWLLPRVVGRARARELLLLGRRLSGDEAVEWGLAHRSVASAEVAATATELVARLAAGPTAAIGLTKRLLNSADDHGLAQHLADEAFAMEVSSRSPDFREGLAALNEKRQPDFTGR